MPVAEEVCVGNGGRPLASAIWMQSFECFRAAPSVKQAFTHHEFQEQADGAECFRAAPTAKRAFAS